MCGDGRRGGKRGAGLDVVGVVVLIAVRDDVERHVRPRRCAISGFEPLQPLVAELRLSEYRHDALRAGAGERGQVDADPAIAARRHPQRARRGRPDALAARELPEDPRCRLPPPPGELAARQAAAQHEVSAPVGPGDLVLREDADRSPGEAGRRQREPLAALELVVGEPIGDARNQIVAVGRCVVLKFRVGDVVAVPH